MLFRQRSWQALPVVATFFAGASLLLLPAAKALAQTSGSSSSSNSLIGGSSGSSGGSSGSSGSTSSSGSGTVAGASTNSLTGSSSSLSGSSIAGTGAGGTTGTSNYKPSTNNGPGPSPSNILAPYYVNPLQPGLPNTSSTSTTGGTATVKGFGTPLYVPVNNSLSSASSSRGSGGGGNGMGSSMGTTTAMSVGPRYTQSVGWKMNAPASPRLQAELQTLVASSQRLSNPKGIQILMDGQTAVLRGTAPDEHERALAAAVISMSPGVYGVRNELKIQAPAATPVASKQP